MIEEAPSPVVTPDLRKKMGDAAVRLARAGGYVNAGTVEFLVDADLNFYFLEVNTRLQVEHPVTEQVTGLDLVKLQIAIAAGHRLPFAWETITPRGHAMEVRLYAEDPDNNFFPSPGKILSRAVPTGPGIRLDEGVYEGWTVPMEYDPLLSKLIAWGNSREETIARLRRALDEYSITGIQTNVNLFRRILVEPDFLRSEIHTKWLDELLAKPRPPAIPTREGTEDAVAIAAALWQSIDRVIHGRTASPMSQSEPSRWKTGDAGPTGSHAMKFEVQLEVSGEARKRVVEIERHGEWLPHPVGWAVSWMPMRCRWRRTRFRFCLNGQSYEIHVAQIARRKAEAADRGARICRGGAGSASVAWAQARGVGSRRPAADHRADAGKSDSAAGEGGRCGAGGQGIAVIEAMKMQNEIRSPKSGKVERVVAKEGQSVSAGEVSGVGGIGSTLMSNGPKGETPDFIVVRLAYGGWRSRGSWRGSCSGQC